jgi:hypothetical protein
MHVHGHRVLLALFGGLTGILDTIAAGNVGSSSSSSSGGDGAGGGSRSEVVTAEKMAAAVMQLGAHQKLASLLTTVLKTASAYAAYLKEQQQDRAVPTHIGGFLVNQAALVMDLSRRLGQLCNVQPGTAAAVAAGTANTSKSTCRADRGSRAGSSSRASSSSSGSSSSNGDSVGADMSREGMALAGKGLLLLCKWVQHAGRENMEHAALLPNSTDSAWQVLHDVGGLLSLGMLLSICSDAVAWFGGQLAAVGPPGLGGTQSAAAQRAAEKLLKQQAAAAVKLGEAAAAANAFKSHSAILQAKRLLAAAGKKNSRLDAMFDACARFADDAGGVDADQQPGRVLHSKVAAAWQALEAFAGSLVVQCPVPSSCGNPACVGFGKLSERRLVFGTKDLTVCSKCKAARFCSKECFQQAWEQHLPVCKRLRAVPRA